MKQIEVQIMGQSYLLGCPEDSEAQLRSAVERVDLAMCRIRDAGKVKARDRIAVLAALNLASDLGQREAEMSAAVVPPTAELPDASPATQPPSASLAAQPADAVPRLSADDEDRAAQLVKRLDQALASDNHLL
ncbi:Cell division protein ZapA [Burkholderiales bacterium 8X]|nr:Cell division protein ZapA [Burkholderiales bacterium 8X]